MLAIAVLIASAASAEAGVGGAVSPDGGASGTGDGGGSSDGGGCPTHEFGQRKLGFGDCGKDVKTLNWILKSEDFTVPLTENFGGATDDSVRSVERDAGQTVNGIVERVTRKAIVSGMPKDRASWYGPGFFGNRTACGQTLKTDTIGVAHRSLPCGTKVVLGYKGEWVRARVIDRGPYAKRGYTRDWDLTAKTARRLRFEGVDRLRAGVIR
jgi:rare lipoprotein A (peptidoglycan hydrolase)